MFINKCVRFGLLLIGLACLVRSKTFVFHNTGSRVIWVGTQGNAGMAPLNDGGWKMEPDEKLEVDTPDNWSGRFWGRTWCDPKTQHCDTGDCGNKLECAGAGGHPPATLVQITLKGGDGNDYYSLSLVDGFNDMSSITPIDGKTTGAANSCKSIACNKDLNKDCPEELQVKTINGVVACRSACSKFNSDEYCCRGTYSKPSTCNSSKWSVNYPKYFKDGCPDAYSYAYDDATSVFTCRADKYLVTFA